MSYLREQIKHFKSSVNSSSNQLASKRTAVAPTKPNSSPLPTDPSNSGQNDPKRKNTEQNNVVYSQPADTGTGRNIMTQITYAISHLKNKGTPLTLTELLSYLSLHNREESYKRTIEAILRKHDKVDYDSKGDASEGTFSFRPAHNIRSADKLLGYLQSQPTAQGVPVRELRDGWPGAEITIDDLELQGKLLVTRNKKDNHAKMVWPNDPSLAYDIDEEFRDIWHKIRLPEPGALADELEREGLTPANKNRISKAKPVKEVRKGKKQRKGGKMTNNHMLGVLRDFSHLRK